MWWNVCTWDAINVVCMHSLVFIFMSELRVLYNMMIYLNITHDYENMKWLCILDGLGFNNLIDIMRYIDL